MSPLSYQSAGVDLELYDEAMSRLPAMMQRTHSPRVMPLVGGFAGLFQLNGAGKSYTNPVLVSGTDGVGTKLKVAQRCNIFNTVGIDLVAMCVNDCLCLGAEPLFFLDYLALGKDNPDLIAQLVEGVTAGCLQAQSALIGGETAIMPSVYAGEEFDLAGFCVGVVEKDQIVDGSRIQVGDQLVAIPSSGLHSNGYSLVRKIVFEHAKLEVGDYIDQLGQTVGEALLAPTRIYADVVAQALAEHRDAIRGIAHITGGGLADNTGRIMPAGCHAVVDRNLWEVPAIFTWLQSLGDVEREEMFRVFNMGVGLVFITDPATAPLLAEKLQGTLIGQVTPGDAGASYVN
ncbi:MAG: phosphoribosylformylglycinamidine cyclo-ligase [Planctomycetaceae bacterium]